MKKIDTIETDVYVRFRLSTNSSACAEEFSRFFIKKVSIYAHLKTFYAIIESLKTGGKYTYDDSG